MRAREILEENYQQNLESDLTNILVGAKGADATDIDTQAVVDQLDSMGYSVNANSLMMMLSRNPMVLNATSQSINLTGAETAGASVGPDQDSAAQVSDMAAKATQATKSSKIG